MGGFVAPITTIQNTQASPEFLTLPQVIPTSIPIPILKTFPFFGGHFIGRSLSGTGELDAVKLQALKKLN